MDEILTAPSVGYTERDLLTKPLELLGREVRHVGTGALGTVIAVSAKPVDGSFRIRVRRHAGQSGQGAPKLDNCKPSDLELVTA